MLGAQVAGAVVVLDANIHQCRGRFLPNSIFQISSMQSGVGKRIKLCLTLAAWSFDQLSPKIEYSLNIQFLCLYSCHLFRAKTKPEGKSSDLFE